MFIILIGIYLFVLTLLAGFFIVTKINAYKFKNYSENIEKYTRAIFIILGILTFAGMSCIFLINKDLKESMVDEETSTQSVYY